LCLGIYYTEFIYSLNLRGKNNLLGLVNLLTYRLFSYSQSFKSFFCFAQILINAFFRSIFHSLKTGIIPLTETWIEMDFFETSIYGKFVFIITTTQTCEKQ